jgi:hypothetical protein
MPVERLTNEDAARDAESRIRALIDAHGEWLYAEGPRPRATLRKSECDFRVSHGRLIFSCWTERGAVAWRITAWEWAGEKLRLEASRRMGGEVARLELIPRASIESLSSGISDVRRERCQRLARLACGVSQGLKVERAGLSEGTRPGKPGRYARILLRRLSQERIAVAGEVAESGSGRADAFLSSSLIWFTRVSERARPPYIKKLWLVVGKDCVGPLGKLLALLREELRRAIGLYLVDDEWEELTRVRAPELDELLRQPAGRLRRPPAASTSESAESIVAHAPEAIDVVRARHGETLRYRGLAFARVRRVMHRESVWFGVAGARPRRLLDESTAEEWFKLLRDLKEYRRADCPDTRHALYSASPEAWLEFELRRDITRLDPGLRLAPLYAQFRPARMSGVSRPVDLLALRHDGRLAVIELKVSEDREHVLQGADYWLRTEIYRRQGFISRARLFGDTLVSNEPPLVYLVAPLLRFHRSFSQLARAVTPEIEIYRFDLNEDWRARVRVARRSRFRQ